MNIYLTALFFHFCYSVGQQQSCFEYGKDYVGSDILPNGLWTLDADECQNFCQKSGFPTCKYWTWILVHDGKDGFKDGLCYLKYSKNHVVNRNNAISGPKYCISTTLPTPISTSRTTSTTSTSSCFQWGIEYFGDGSTYVTSVKSPEECQWYCNYYQSECKYWTWFPCQDSYWDVGDCKMTKVYPTAIESNGCAVSGPKDCNDPQTTTSTEMSTTWNPDSEGSNSVSILSIVIPTAVILGIIIICCKSKTRAISSNQGGLNTNNNGISVISSQDSPGSIQHSCPPYQDYHPQRPNIYQPTAPPPPSPPITKNVYEPPTYEEAMSTYNNVID